MDPPRLNTTCGVSNSVFIYIIGVLCLVESVTLVSLNTIIFLHIDDRHDIESDIWWIDNQIRPQHITLLFIPLNCVRVFVALALIAGRFANNTSSLPFFIVFTVLGIAGNIGAGSVAVGFPITYNIGVATFCVVILHTIYVLIGSKIFLQERASRKKISLGSHTGNT